MTLGNALQSITFNDIKILCGIGAFTALTALGTIPVNEGVAFMATLVGVSINTNSTPVITTTTTAPTANITTSVTKPA